MKHLFLFFSLLFASSIYGQSLNGMYSSNHTTYEDKVNPENNFEEETLFKLIVRMEDERPGMLGILDPWYPTNLLLYVLGSVKDVLHRDEGTIILFYATTDHLDQNEKVEVMFHIATSGDLINIMIYNSNYSQIYHDIKVREK